jgi:Mrp family chromosome partitioning ATPase/uncharacterized coiled-coil protein SlyX
VESPRKDQVISVTFSSRSSDVVQPVLDQVITNYIAMHLKVHLPPNGDWLSRENSMREQDLMATEAQLANLKSSAGLVSLKDEEAAFKQQEGLIQQENYMALAELEDSLGRLRQLQKLLPGTNQAPATNAAAPSIAAPSETTVNDYRRSQQRLVELEAREADYEVHYTTNNMLVQTNLIEIQTTKDKLRSLEDENPGLLTIARQVARATTGAPAAFDVEAACQSEMSRIQGLAAKTNEFSRLLQLFAERGTNLNHLAVAIEDLERVKALQEDNLKRVASQMYENKLDGAAGKSKGANITVIQNPSPPASDTRKSNKVEYGIAIGGVVLGFALAFLWEMLLDRSLRRPREVVERLKLPMLLNIPYMKNVKNGNGNGRFGFFKRGKDLKPGKELQLLSGGAGDPASPGNRGGELAPVRNGPPALWNEKLGLRPFHDTLRDRLVAHFEMNNLTHKPKLVAVTSCAEGAGVSTIAAGLACSLSETGEGNVLLVDMNSGDGLAHRFYKGKLAMGLDDLLEKEKADRQGALVQENLYVVKEFNNRDKLPSVLPKRFSHLVSQLKASDYDYILLDMPPVTEISITPRLARFMDTILLVVESERTDQDAAQRAAALLSEGRANVQVVMNKSRSYVPKRLQPEL